MSKISLGVIHNRELDRMSELGKTIELIREATFGYSPKDSLLNEPVIVEANQTPLGRKGKAWLAVFVLQFSTFSKSTYLRFGFGKSFIYAVTSELLGNFTFILSNPGREIDKRLYIDRELTSKHLRIWNTFLNLDSEFLIVVESDAKVTPNSKSYFTEILNAFEISSLKGNDGNYCDLAGGFGLADIYGQNINEMKSDSVFKTHELGFVNTTCGYLVDRKFIESLLRYVAKRPLCLRLSVDSLMNNFLHSRSGREVSCLHPIRLPFEHGSQFEKRLGAI